MAESGQSSMECESVEDRLLDLVYGELDEREAHEVRAHAERCEGCRRSLARLEGGRVIARRMEVVEPRADLFEAVRAAAQARAAEVKAAAATDTATASTARLAGARAKAAEAGPPRDWWSELLRWLGSMAMGPQVAMATLLLLMVGIGLWSLPRLRGRGERLGERAEVGPEPGGEVAPSPALEPAEPLAFDFDPRTRRLAPVGEETEASAPRQPAELRQAAPPAPEATRPGVVAGERRAAAPRRDPNPIAPAPERAPAEAASDDALAMEFEQDLAPGEAVGASQADEGSAPPVEPQRGAYAAVERTPSARPPATSAPQEYAAAPETVARPQPDTDAMLASAAHRQARDAASRGANAECIRQYESLLSRWPRYAEGGRALLELAECQRRAGRTADARRSLERAERIPSVRAEATRELARIQMEERAAEIPDTAAAAE